MPAKARRLSEWANYYTPVKNLAIDFDLANSKALFTTIDEDDAAPDGPGRKRVPEAVGLAISSGITAPDVKGFWRICAYATLAPAT
jgi:hypothetical protein